MHQAQFIVRPLPSLGNALNRAKAVVTRLQHPCGGLDRDTVVVEREPVVVDHQEAAGAESEVVTTHADSWTLARGGMGMFNSLIAFALLIVETLLAFRLGFALGGINRSNGFVEFIYDASKSFVAPFEGIAAMKCPAGQSSSRRQ